MATAPETVVLLGAESTGKTTLAARLAEHYGAMWCPEYAREFAEAKNGPLDSGDVKAIAEGQLALEEDYLDRCGGFLVFDTSILSTIVYSHYYYGNCPDWIEQAFNARDYGLHLLMDVDAPWRPDLVRDGPEPRRQIHERFRQSLRRHDCRYAEIQGDWPARLQSAISEIDAYLEAARRNT